MMTRKELLYTKRLEGATHKTGPNPGWSTGGRKWPTFLRNFRHKLITRRLPTAHNRAFRGDSENGVQINPWCPRCMDIGDFNQETHEHLLTCPCTLKQRLKLAKSINNDCKQYYKPSAVTPTLDSNEEEEIVADMGSSWDTTEAWKSVSADKHGRERTIDTGQPGRQYEQVKFITPWAHNILRHCQDHIHPQDQRSYLTGIKACSSIDPHLLQGIALAIHATTIHDSIPHNPFIPTPTRLATTTPSGDLPLVLNGVGSDVDWSQVMKQLPHTRPWVILLDDSQTDTFTKHNSTPALTTIPKDNISLWGRSFWEGRSGLFPETLESPITVYASNLVTPMQRTMILDTIFMRSKKGGKLSDSPTINPVTLTQETPTSISTLLHEDTNSPAKLQLLSGIISKVITDTWFGAIPASMHQKLYRTLHMTIISHQHSAWIERNEILHPQTETFIPTDYGRAPARQSRQLEDEETNPKDRQWKRQRAVAMTRKAMWEGTPIPPPPTKKNTSSTSLSAASSTDEDSPPPSPSTRKRTRSNTPTSDGTSDTDEWPSPIPQRRKTTATSKDTNKRKRHHPISIRKTPRPTKRHMESRHEDTQPSPHQTPLTMKRKRHHPVTIRKSTRPTKRKQKHIRRNIDELIAYIHSSQSCPHQQDDNRTTRVSDQESDLSRDPETKCNLPNLYCAWHGKARRIG